MKILENLEKKFLHLDLCNVRDIPALGNMQEIHPPLWRFLSISGLDENAEIFFSRDLDSQILDWEAAAANVLI